MAEKRVIWSRRRKEKKKWEREREREMNFSDFVSAIKHRRTCRRELNYQHLTLPAVSENDQRLFSPDVISNTAVQKFILKTAKDKSVSLEKTTGLLLVFVFSFSELVLFFFCSEEKCLAAKCWLMLRPVEREMKRDSWSLFLFFVAMTKHNGDDGDEGRQREKERSDRFVCIANASMCTQSSDQVSSLEIRAVELFLDLYKQTRTIFTNPNLLLTRSFSFSLSLFLSRLLSFSYICFRKKRRWRRRKDKKKKKKKKKGRRRKTIHKHFKFKIIVFYQVKVLVVDGFSLFEDRNDNDLLNYSMMRRKEMKHSVAMTMMSQRLPLPSLPIAYYYRDNGLKRLRHRPGDCRQVRPWRNRIISLSSTGRGMMAVELVVRGNDTSPDSRRRNRWYVVARRVYQWRVSINPASLCGSRSDCRRSPADRSSEMGRESGLSLSTISVSDEDDICNRDVLSYAVRVNVSLRR